METSPVNSRPATTIPSSALTISKITLPAEVSKHQVQLCKTLQACVDEGSSIGFLLPLSFQDASAYWDQVSQLMDYVEEFARDEGKEFLTLDTATLSPA
jgi:hypothetical protein